MDHASTGTDHQAPEDVPGSLTLSGAVSLGTGVMIGAGIFALTGQTARLAGDLFRRGSFRLTAGALYAVSALLILLLTVLSGAVASIPAWSDAGSIADVGVSHGAVLAAVIASLGGVHWWATKVGRQPATASW